MTNPSDSNIQEETIDLKEYLKLFFKHKLSFIISVIIAVTVAFSYLHISQPEYSVSASIMLESKESMEIIDLLSSFSKAETDIENAKTILVSQNLTNKTLKNLDFETSYFKKENFSFHEKYPFSDFSFEFPHSQTPLLNTPLIITTIDQNHFHLQVLKEPSNGFNESTPLELDTICQWDRLFKTEQITFLPLKKRDDLEPNSTYKVVKNSNYQLVKQWQNITVNEINSGTVISLTLQHTIPQKASKFLNEHCNQFLQKSVSKKDQMACKTIEFIDSQLETFKDSLASTEQALENFKLHSSVIDLTTQGEEIYSELNELKNQEARLNVKAKYYQYLIENIKNEDKNEELVSPSAMDINDPVLNKLVIELNTLLKEKSDIERNLKTTTPFTEAHQERIQEQKKSVLEIVENIHHNILFQINDLGERIESYQSQLNTVPLSQKKYLRIQRKFELNEELFTFLLKKRADIQIIKASNLPKDEILDAAHIENAKLVKPRKSIILSIALLLGLALPAMIIISNKILNNNIVTKKDIDNLTSEIPFLGNIMQSQHPFLFSSHELLISNTAESFRSLRTNLQFSILKNKGNVIMISSSIAGEGKSFISANLASCLALNNKKTAIIGGDMRKPSLHRYLNLEKKSKGLSNFLANKATLKEITQKTEVENLDCILSGSIPPNPNELLSSPKFAELMGILKERYNFIIIDTPPIGIVSDSLIIHRHSDSNILVVRSKLCSKDMLNQTVQLLESKELGHFGIVLNDIKKEDLGYNYSYDYRPKPKSKLRNIFSKKESA